MSEEQHVVYLMIKQFIKDNGYSPTIREICELTGRSSPGTIHFHLKHLKALGYINYKKGKSRTIRVIKSDKKKK